MSRRNRERKLRRLEEQKAVRHEMRERELVRTAGLRRWLRTLGLMVAGLAVTAGLIFGVVKGVQSIHPQISGPFGKIAKAELLQNKFATLETDQGNIKIELTPQTTPKTVANFVLLAQKKFYDGIKFHRIVKDFMIQAGDPNSRDDDPSNDGTGGPGYQFNDEKVVGDYLRGTVAMANAGANTNGSQFFIMQQDNTSLPKNYVIFGKVVEGMDVVDKIADLPVVDNGQGEVSQPKKAPVINTVVLSEN